MYGHHRSLTAHAVLGTVIPIGLWLLLVPWDPSSADDWDRALAMVGVVVLVTSVACGASAFMERAAGRYFVVAAFLTSLSLFIRLAATAEDPLWPVAALLFLLLALGALVLAFALGRLFRSGSPMG